MDTRRIHVFGNGVPRVDNGVPDGDNGVPDDDNGVPDGESEDLQGFFGISDVGNVLLAVVGAATGWVQTYQVFKTWQV